MWWKQILMALIGFSSGLVVAGGVFALIASIGIVTRLAGKTHTGKYVKIYEDCITVGGTLGNLIYIYYFRIPVGIVGCVIFGLFSGIFVGVLALSLAEAVNVSAVFTRRIRLSKGIAYVVTGVAIGKLVGAFMQLYNGW
ncbi:MAG: stage V sporulation protein AB [Clostridiales bacterium]|nr:stage V sporulation protein AB [Clostridiales bacterium]